MKEYNIEKIQNFVLNKTTSFINIVKHFNIPLKENQNFSSFLKKNVNKNLLFQTKNSEYFYLPKIKTLIGQIKINPKGFGFVDETEEISYFIPKNYTNNSLNGDTVEITIFDDVKRSSQFAVVNKIVSRAENIYFGTIEENNGYFDFKPLDSKINGKFRWAEKYQLNNKDVVKVKIIEYKEPIFKIELLSKHGQIDEPYKDIEITIEKSSWSHVFSSEVLEYAKQIPQTIENENLENRVDLRNEIIVTIDGDDTKDFDDAISVKKTENGNFILAVHIADVSYYVKENDPIDEEAKLRGTSVYLADRVIPMLPFELSNGICSLNPNVDRFTLTMECEINSQGENEWVKFYPSIINSYQRLTYKEVNKFYNNEKQFDTNISNLLKNAYELTEIIRQYKKKQGFIDFEFDESKVVLDENGKTIDIVLRERNVSENMIEDFMVRANENIAEFMYKKKLPSIYRIHPVPEIEKIENLNSILKLLNINVKVPISENPVDFANAIEKVKEINFDNFIKINLLRTMQKAIYSDVNVGHFGLASEYYTHFTSPIRRYPDLIVHRLLREFVFLNKMDKLDYFKKELAEIAMQNSLSEQGALALEREVFAIKVAEFYENKINQEFDAQIVSVKKFGLFVELNTGASALIHISSLPGENYLVDDKELFLENQKHKFQVGQWVKIKIESTIKFEGKINATLSQF
ncbi:ribonuclease R [Mesomycoplasma lagogenitalium]|uniref:Ribonuclease R n=1 Tax=Mesomycoplasma lagogenitalium TaxID=171286 RepID=A0ABY8LWT5_9BACT|nr:ribonuclease R [Mesomycoplasma lagogenitalium]WGI36716.1 ribonuclease R [Mesomycoplasma lagogenitalium]